MHFFTWVVSVGVYAAVLPYMDSGVVQIDPLHFWLDAVKVKVKVEDIWYSASLSENLITEALTAQVWHTLLRDHTVLLVTHAFI